MFSLQTFISIQMEEILPKQRGQEEDKDNKDQK